MRLSGFKLFVTDPVSDAIMMSMARRIPHGRFGELVDCATRVFIDCGYRRTQIADIATAMGVAKGSIYNYVESKEALFDLVARCADRSDWRGDMPKLPIPTPKSGATLRYVRAQLIQRQATPILAEAIVRKQIRDVRTELNAVVSELYDLLADNRYSITLIDRSTRDYPELAILWLEARDRLLTSLESYLKSRIASGKLRSVPDSRAAARFILEAATYWAVHRYWDLRPDSTDDSVAKETVGQFILNALIRTAP
jgi:AcrR family transcriptional regulator